MIRTCVRPLLLAITLSAVSSPCGAAVDFTLTMDDLPQQQVHGLVHPSGVQFEFTQNRRPSTDALYNSNGPGPIVFVQDPSIEGTSAGVLAITFPLPTPVLQFGLARSIDVATAAVELFDSSNSSLGISNMSLTAMPIFAEGQFNYSGLPVKRATISFAEPITRFAFDNLVFRVVPEPAACIGMSIGSFVGLVRCRRRR